MRILALDIATTTGWASWDGKKKTASGTQSFKPGRGDSPGMRFLRFRKWLDQMFEIVKPDVIAYERPNTLRSTPANECVFGLTAAMHEEATSQEVETLSIGTSELKKHATGKGNAGKPQMQKAAKARWSLPEVVGHDESDALLLLAFALEELGEVPKYANPKMKITIRRSR